MARPKRKNKVRQLAAYIDEGIFDRFEDYCENQDRTKSAALEEVLKMYLDTFDEVHREHTGQ